MPSRDAIDHLPSGSMVAVAPYIPHITLGTARIIAKALLFGLLALLPMQSSDASASVSGTNTNLENTKARRTISSNEIAHLPTAKPNTRAKPNSQSKTKKTKRKRSKPNFRSRTLPDLDGCRLPKLGNASIHRKPQRESERATIGWLAPLLYPRLPDPRRRIVDTHRPIAFGETIKLGERYVFDVSFAGNPAGTLDVSVAGLEPDPRGPPPNGNPKLRLEAVIHTTGIISMLATIKDHMITWIDSKTGAAIRTVNTLKQSGLGVGYRKRQTETDYQGRGHIRILDVVDNKRRKLVRRVPADTLDPISAIAWVRALDLQPGQRATAHTMDLRVLLRIEVINRGPKPLKPMPSIAAGLGIGRGDLDLYEGTLTRVDRYDQPIPDKRTYTFRAWVGRGKSRILLAMESDMWLGVIRLNLSRYDPPIPKPGFTVPSSN